MNYLNPLILEGNRRAEQARIDRRAMAIKAPGDHLLVVADASQIEARILAYLAKARDLDIERFTYGSPDTEKVKRMVLLMRMLAPEWEFNPQSNQMVPAGWYGVYCSRTPCPCYVPIDYIRMEIDPIFMMGVNHLRSRSNAT